MDPVPLIPADSLPIIRHASSHGIPLRSANTLPHAPSARRTRALLPSRPQLPYQPRKRQQRQQPEQNQQDQDRQRIGGVALDHLELAVGFGAAVAEPGEDGLAWRCGAGLVAAYGAGVGDGREGGGVVEGGCDGGT